MSETTLVRGTWVASGPSGVVGSLHRVDGGFTFRLLKDADSRPVYPTFEVAKSALHAALGPGADWPEFTEH